MKVPLSWLLTETDCPYLAPEPKRGKVNSPENVQYVAGEQGPGATHTPITLLHATLTPGARLRLPWRRDFNALAYVLAGSGSVGAEYRPVQMGQLAVFGAGDVLTVTASQHRPSDRNFTSCVTSGVKLIKNQRFEIIEAAG